MIGVVFFDLVEPQPSFLLESSIEAQQLQDQVQIEFIEEQTNIDWCL